MPDACSTIDELIAQISDWSNRKGWWDAKPGQPEPTFLEKACLFHAEISEAAEEYRNHGLDADKFIYYGPSDAVPVAAKASGVKPDEGGAERNHSGGKPEGIAVELADCVIRVLDACGHWKIPLAEAIAVKMAYNETRPYRHGNKVA